MYRIRELNLYIIHLDKLLLIGDAQELKTYTGYKSPDNNKTNLISSVSSDIIDTLDYKQLERLRKRIKIEIDKVLNTEECFCCHRMISCDKLKQINSINTSVKDNPIFNELMELNKTRNLKMVCKPYCLDHLEKNSVPPYSSLNNMRLEITPIELKCLNFYERLLIQKAKCFQTIIHLKPYKKIFSHINCPALKGI